MSRLLDQILGISRRESLPCDDNQLYMVKRKVKVVNERGDTFKTLEEESGFIISESPEEYRGSMRGLVKSGMAIPVILPEGVDPERVNINPDPITEVPLEIVTEALLDTTEKVVTVPPVVDGHVAEYSQLSDPEIVEEVEYTESKKDKLKKKLHEIRKNRT